MLSTTATSPHEAGKRLLSKRSKLTYYSVDEKLVKGYICNTKDPNFKDKLTTLSMMILMLQQNLQYNTANLENTA